MTPTPEQLVFHQEKVKKYRMGGFQHSSCVISHTFGMGIHNIAPVDPPVVCLSQDDDPYYSQYFNSRDEVEAFIAELRKCADEAWGQVQDLKK